MIQDIAPYKFFNAYQNNSPSEDSIILYFEQQSVLVAEEQGEIKFPMHSQWKDQSTTFNYVFSINDTAYYLADSISEDLLTGYSMQNIHLFRNALPRHNSFAGITAFHVNNWYQSHQFCGKCGNKMTHASKERMLYCENCNQTEYPKIAPAVIVAVTNGDKLLLSRYAQGNYKKYALLAGFTEVGESIEETVAREVMEEVGLQVKNVRYYKSQPWSFSETLLMGFFAEVDGDDTITLDREELEEAVWVSRDEIKIEHDNLSLTNEMIVKFKNTKADK